MEIFTFVSAGIIAGLLYHEHLWQQTKMIGRGIKHFPLYNFWIRYLLLSLVFLLGAVTGGRNIIFLSIGVLLGRPLYMYLFRKRIGRSEEHTSELQSH